MPANDKQIQSPNTTDAQLAELAQLLKMYRSKVEDFLALEQEILKTAHHVTKEKDLESTRKKLEALM